MGDIAYSRSSLPEMFCKYVVLKNFAKFTGKHLCWSLFLDKVATWRPATLLRNRLQRRYFPVNFAEHLRILFYRTLPVAASIYSKKFLFSVFSKHSRWVAKFRPTKVVILFRVFIKTKCLCLSS